MEEIQRGKQDKQSAAQVKSAALSFGISQGKPEAADCISHRQRRVITFWPSFRPGQKCFSLNQFLNPVNPVKKLFYLLGCGHSPP